MSITEKMELRAIEGKMLFHEGSTAKAERHFIHLIKAGYRDSAVFFLYGLILIEKGQRELAEGVLQKAAEMESDFFLYQFRLAENRFLLGQNPEEALNKAYHLNPDDPWVNNLFGQYLMKLKRFDEAHGFFCI